MYLTLAIDYDPAKTDGVQSVYDHIQEVLKPLLSDGWGLTHYAWDADKLQEGRMQKFTATLQWGLT